MIVNVYYNKKLSEFNEVKDFEKMNDYVSRYPNQWVLEIWLDQLQLSRGTSVKDLKFIDFWAFDFFDDSYSLEDGRVRSSIIRTPSLTNIGATQYACIGNHITDGQLCIVQCDPCFTCTDRAFEIINL